MKTDYKFEIGQKVKVIDCDFQYSSWDTKARQMGLKKWKVYKSAYTGKIGEITTQDIHDKDKTIIYGITCEDGSQHIMSEAGLEAYTETFTPQTAITISRALLGEYYEAATTQQREYMSDNFKLNGETTVEAIVGLYDIACFEWKPIIKKNHPECFPEESKYFDLSYLSPSRKYPQIFTDKQAQNCGFENADFIQVRASGKYGNKAFYLHFEYDWEMTKDENGDSILIPTKK